MSLSDNLAVVRERISRACQRVSRNPDEVTLLAVTKNHPASTVAEAISLGVTMFGENRIQEARAKIPACPSSARWHFIGHLQSNKAREAVHWFSMIESLDSLALAQELQKQAEKLAKTIPVLAEVNIAGESSKFGWNPAQLLAELPDLNRLSRLELHGLMTVAPYATNPEKVRPVFRRLRELRDQCTEILGAPMTVLSMGMSQDLEVAIEEGATLVRVGTALFGPRPTRRAESEPNPE